MKNDKDLDLGFEELEDRLEMACAMGGDKIRCTIWCKDGKFEVIGLKWEYTDSVRSSTSHLIPRTDSIDLRPALDSTRVADSVLQHSSGPVQP